MTRLISLPGHEHNRQEHEDNCETKQDRARTLPQAASRAPVDSGQRSAVPAQGAEAQTVKKEFLHC